jgi:predicted site-specific integrase-resolvase
MGPKQMTDELMTAAEVADLLGVTEATLANYRSTGKGPRYIKPTGRIKYRKSDVWAFINGSVRQSTCEAA